MQWEPRKQLPAGSMATDPGASPPRQDAAFLHPRQPVQDPVLGVEVLLRSRKGLRGKRITVKVRATLYGYTSATRVSRATTPIL
jgi:hypothetical protein